LKGKVYFIEDALKGDKNTIIRAEMKREIIKDDDED
jgi:hypothetical protein